MPTLENNFEGGSNGVAISVGNSGGASGNAFDSVTIGATATVEYTTSQDAHGSVGAHITSGASGGAGFVSWTSGSVGTQARLYGRLYFRMDALPAAQYSMVQILQGASVCARIAVGTDGKIRVLNTSNSTVGTTTAAIKLDKWYRVEWDITCDAASGQALLHLYSGDNTTPLSTIDTAATQSFFGDCNAVRAGLVVGQANFPNLYLDDFNVNTTALPGPAAAGTGLEATNNAEGGTSGATVTTSNSAGASGDSFDQVVIGTDATLNFSDTHAAHGTKSYQFATDITSAQSYLLWNVNTIANLSRAYGRLYFLFTTVPSASLSLIQFAIGGTAQARIQMGSDAKVRLINKAGSTVATTSAAFTTNVWYRVEWDITFSAAGSGTVNLYLNDNPTPMTDGTATGTSDFGAAIDTVRWGLTSAQVNQASLWLDDININETAMPGPAGANPDPVIVVAASNSFNDGTSGDDVDTETSGASGDPFNQVVNNDSPTSVVEYSSAHSISGGMACKISTGAAAAQSYVGWTSATVGSLDRIYGRAYFYMSALPSVNFSFVQIASSSTSRCRLQLGTDGFIRIVNAAGSTVATTSAVYTVNRWYRLEWNVECSATGDAEARLYLGNDEATVTTASVGSANFGGVCDAVRFGVTGGSANIAEFWIDDVAISSTEWLGPAGAGVIYTTPVTVLAAGNTEITGTVSIWDSVNNIEVPAQDVFVFDDPNYGNSAPAFAAQFHMWEHYYTGGGSTTTNVQYTQHLDALQDMGVKIIRIDFGFSSSQPTDDPFDIDYYYNQRLTNLLADASSRGIDAFLTIWRSPEWARPGTGSAASQFPTDLVAWEDWCREVATHFGSDIIAAEIWNEPNLSSFTGVGNNNPAAYMPILEAAFNGVKAGDSSVPVVFGGPAETDWLFIDECYDLGAKDFCDIMSFHPYQGNQQVAPESTSTSGIDKSIAGWEQHRLAIAWPKVVEVMIAHGDEDKPIWGTEQGWSAHDTSTTIPNRGVGPTGVPGTWATLQHKAGDYIVRSIEWYRLNAPNYRMHVVYVAWKREPGAADQDNFRILEDNGDFLPQADMLQEYYQDHTTIRDLF